MNINCLSVIFVGIYVVIGWLVALTKRVYRHETRDMKKYILGKIKDIDEKMNELQAEREELLSSLPN